ncbi:MAG: DUF3127 domain-containing protein [Chitinophagaceae bacterium]|nr:DUF3127 domain-containing protein [Chitinophagaceae bacterium]
MEIAGTLIHMLPLQSGQGKNGTWKKQEFVIETADTYPKKVCLAAWGDKIDTSKFVIGQQLKVNFDVESREYNGRWYTDLKAYAVQLGSSSATSDMPPSHQGPIDNEPPDDLPF